MSHLFFYVSEDLCYIFRLVHRVVSRVINGVWRDLLLRATCGGGIRLLKVMVTSYQSIWFRNLEDETFV